MFRFISRHILTGLMTILPVLLSFYLLYWFAVTAETMLGKMMRMVISEDYYWPGMGLVVGLVVVFFIGLMMHAYIVQRLFARGEKILYRMPLIKSVYRAIRDFFNYFSPDKDKEFDQVVAVRIGDMEMEVIGFITQSNSANLPADFRGDDHVLVYIPLSYMIGGYTVLVPRSATRPVNMNMEEAMRFTLTAGVTR
ncbi:MAG: DUF502 domain-containing protein [Gammaproteobacteria bacterium]|nr:DUF502 domain-containing protein [Gammaproteobacteria bacterium]